MERYSLHKVIGEGSFGRALLVRCKSTQEKYVVKEIQLPKNKSKLENWRREAVLLSRMKHPNIVAFREAFEADDLLCIVMEYCSGGDLLQRIRQQKTTQFYIDDVLRWFAQMCAAAKYIHDKRVLHRDLKSKNIFLRDNGTIKLGDFGSACVLNSSKAYAHAYVGTPYYVAPEIWDNKPYNNKSDVWSLGCVLYELCTLRHPFQASSWRSLILKVCRGAYPPLPNHLPYELQYLVKQMFKTNPKDRPSLHTILTCHRVSKLLRTHLPCQRLQILFQGGEEVAASNYTTRSIKSHTLDLFESTVHCSFSASCTVTVTQAAEPEAIETEERGRRPGRWNREEGTKVADLLGEKSLIKTSTFEGVELPEACCESREPAPRKQWATEPSDTVMQMLANASLISNDSMASDSRPLAGSAHGSVSAGQKDGRQRRRWDKDPPERLLNMLEKAQLQRAFSTFLINRGGDDPLVGPLSQPQGDDTDGPEPEVAVDEDRLQPRSDDEDTDFEEEHPSDWIDELDKMFSEH